MCSGIDEERTVMDEDRANEAAPDETSDSRPNPSEQIPEHSWQDHPEDESK